MPNEHMSEACRLARAGVEAGRGGPFGAVVVRAGEVIGRAANGVTGRNDPTAHAEVEAIRAACAHVGSFRLEGCEIYCSCEPCPMCLGAIRWARLDKIYYAATRDDAAAAGFGDALFWADYLAAPDAWGIATQHLPDPEALAVLDLWRNSPDKTNY